MAQDIIARAMASKAASLGGGTKLYKHTMTLTDELDNKYTLIVDSNKETEYTLASFVNDFEQGDIISYNFLFNAEDGNDIPLFLYKYQSVIEVYGINILDVTLSSSYEIMSVDSDIVTSL